MHIIWENLLAAILMMSIALTLVVVNARNQETLTETTAYYTLKTQGTAFTEILKRDLQGVEEVFTYAELDGVFQFRARIGQENTSRQIEYRRNQVTQRDGITFYEIQRFVDGERRGGSMSAITEWEIQALNEEGQPINDQSKLGDCNQILVRFEAASPFVETETVDRMRWESRFFPPLRSRSTVL